MRQKISNGDECPAGECQMLLIEIERRSADDQQQKPDGRGHIARRLAAFFSLRADGDRGCARWKTRVGGRREIRVRKPVIN